jgi:hypothetical protein
MTGHDFLMLAGRLAAASNPTEATCRTVISRAYYGAFHIARRALEDIGVKVGSNHGHVWRLLQVSGDEIVEDAGDMLTGLHSERVHADYHLDSGERADIVAARLAVEKAQEIVRLLEIVGSAKDDIRRSIEAYLQKFGGKLP